MFDQETMKLLYQRMCEARFLEYGIKEQHAAGKVRGPVHLCVGQEAVGVGAGICLRDDDYITSTHRGHAHFVGKGLELKPMVAEMMGKAPCYCGGRASHMLIACKEKGCLGGCGIVCGALGIAVGYGLSFKMDKSDRVCLSFVGDGASNEGMFHEAMNMAALWKTNNVIIAEHNMYGLTVHATRHLSVTNIADRAAAYGIPGLVIDGNDIIEVIQATQEAVARARRGEGPTLIEAKTYRILGFSTGDKGGYQPQEEIDAWSAPEKDAIARYGKYLVDQKICTSEEVDALKAQAKALVDEAIEYGLNAPYPDASTLMEGIYA